MTQREKVSVQLENDDARIKQLKEELADAGNSIR